MTQTTTSRYQLDGLDRRIVAALQMDGRASWTAIAEQVSTSVPTVARRAQQLMAEGVVRIAVVPDINHAGPADLFILRVNCEPGTTDAVASTLAQRDDIRFLALVTGSADIVAELNTLKTDSLRGRLIDEVQAIENVLRCETDLVLHTYKVAHDWSRQLLTGEEYTPPTTDTHQCDPSHFDDTDRAMLALLHKDGRAGFRSVSESLGVNESTARRRFESLSTRGCAWVLTLVSASALGFEQELLFVITVAPHRLDVVAHELASYRGVRYVAATLGSSSLMCEVILPTTQDVFEFVTSVLGQLEGVQGWTAGMELLTYKRGFVEIPRTAFEGANVSPPGEAVPKSAVG